MNHSRELITGPRACVPLSQYSRNIPSRIFLVTRWTYSLLRRRRLAPEGEEGLVGHSVPYSLPLFPSPSLNPPSPSLFSLPRPFSLSPSHKSLSLLVATFVGVNQRARVPTLRGLRELSRIETTMIMSCTVPDVYAPPLFTLFCYDRYGIATVFLP